MGIKRTPDLIREAIWNGFIDFIERLKGGGKDNCLEIHFLLLPSSEKLAF
jgi:hypothetical protein